MTAQFALPMKLTLSSGIFFLQGGSPDILDETILYCAGCSTSHDPWAYTFTVIKMPPYVF